MTFKDFFNNLLYYGLEVTIGKFYSCYRGYVIDNNDSDDLNRIKVRVPMVTRHNIHTVWAWPKGVYGGNNYGMQILPG